jgi:HlyD family secretion protein
MKIAELRRLPSVQDTPAAIRTTSGQDKAVEAQPVRWYLNRKVQVAAGAGLAILAVLAWLLVQWADLKQIVSAERIRVSTVSRGHFVRDVAAQGSVIAAVNPTLFASAPGTISYLVRTGDTVTKGQPLATLDSPALRNELEREQATLDSLNAALDRQEIEIRRQILLSRQQADVAKVAITAASREKDRAQAAWDERVISERDFRRAVDDLDTAKLNYEHAAANADLERDSLALELRTKRLERDRQRLAVENLRRRVDELTVRSPVDGMVANLAQAEKAHVAESAPLITVVDLTAFEIEFQVSETYAGEIKPGMVADITLDGRRHAGTVTAISPEVRQSQVTGRVKFDGEQPPRLRQNQRASLRIVLDERDDVLRFERSSFIDESTQSVFVVRGDRAVRVPVQLGAASVAEIEVLRGLAAGDKVIVSDMRDFQDADEVAISN